VTHKVFAKILYDRLLRHANAAVHQLFALRQILEKCNHNKKLSLRWYGRANFLRKLLRLTKATLTIVTCCVKIQNDCSESFETRQGLRQGDVLFTLLFNVMLEVIVRRANLQTNEKFVLAGLDCPPILIKFIIFFFFFFVI
jgi:hypothetical protein